MMRNGVNSILMEGRGQKRLLFQFGVSSLWSFSEFPTLTLYL